MKVPGNQWGQRKAEPIPCLSGVTGNASSVPALSVKGSVSHWAVQPAYPGDLTCFCPQSLEHSTPWWEEQGGNYSWKLGLWVRVEFGWRSRDDRWEKGLLGSTWEQLSKLKQRVSSRRSEGTRGTRGGKVVSGDNSPTPEFASLSCAPQHCLSAEKSGGSLLFSTSWFCSWKPESKTLGN